MSNNHKLLGFIMPIIPVSFAQRDQFERGFVGRCRHDDSNSVDILMACGGILVFTRIWDVT
jgi:hypothetical protein